MYSMKKIFVLLLASFSLLYVNGQGKAKLPVMMASASQKFLANDFWGALDTYRKAQKIDPSSAKIIYKIGECHYNLKHYKHAKTYFSKADSADTNVDEMLYYNLGRTYHRLAELDKAKDYYQKYRSIAPERDLEFYDINGLIKQCEYAKQMMASPLDVKIDNLGRAINSRFDDYAPSLNSDGTIMMFTSRRAQMESSDVDERGDFKYFESIYMSEREDINSRWTQAEQVAELNAAGHNAVLSLAPDAKEMFIYKNNINTAGDIFKATRESSADEWMEPKKLQKPINTTYFESSISITADGSTMYFISERPGGYGRGDIYVTRKTGENSWSKPENVGEVINTPKDEKFVFVHPNGSTIFFASEGHLTMGSYDIFKSELKDGAWTEPVNLGYPINTVNEESTFSMTGDNKKLLISAEYDNTMGERDIYEIDLSNVKILDILNIDSDLLSEKANAVVHGHVRVEKNAKNVRYAEITVMDSKGEKELYKGMSDKNGYFEFSLPFGSNYIIQVTSDKYGEKEAKVKLKNRELVGENVRQDIVF